MAVEFKGGLIAKKAGADLTGKKYYGIKLDTNGAVVVAGANEAIGILIEEGTADQNVSIQITDGTKMVAAEAVKAGAFGTTDAAGKLVNADTVGDRAFVIALEEATAAGQLVPVQIINGGVIKIA